MINYDALYERMQRQLLSPWQKLLPKQLENQWQNNSNGNLTSWLDTFKQLPELTASSIDLNTGRVRIGKADDMTNSQRDLLAAQLKQFHPWRKGPFELFGIDIDTEWRSDWKWDRLKNHIKDIKNRTVLDVGCGNGYHCWRLAGAGADLVIGIDPTWYSVMQFHAIQNFVEDQNVFVLPLGIDDLPEKLQAFDTVLSLGVLYHRRSPLDHIMQLWDCLKPGGELVLETLIIDGGVNDVLLPEDRYAKMRNVWFIPSCAMLERWLNRCNFKNIRIVDVTATTIEEQHSTEWMTFESLVNFLDPNDAHRTVEGYPAPQRAIVIAEKP